MADLLERSFVLPARLGLLLPFALLACSGRSGNGSGTPVTDAGKDAGAVADAGASADAGADGGVVVGVLSISGGPTLDFGSRLVGG